MDNATTQNGHTGSSIHLMPISEEEFQALRKLVYDRFGINLTEQKRLLVVGRLQKVLKSRGFATFRDYYNFLVNDKSGKAIEELAARISTNHTFFYRESDHFEYFVNTVLPEAVQRHQRRNDLDLRIWCAGCSSGEEPYTLAMLLLEYFGAEYSRWKAGILATDISLKVLETAIKGVYNDERVKPLPENLKRKYLKHIGDDEWTVVDRIKSEITFRCLNLMNEKFPFRKQFDAIFCRNVMIYFDQPTRDGLVKRFDQCLAPGGILFIGHSESLRSVSCPLKYVMPAVYRKEGI